MTTGDAIWLCVGSGIVGLSIGLALGVAGWLREARILFRAWGETLDAWQDGDDIHAELIRATIEKWEQCLDRCCPKEAPDGETR